MRDEAFDALPAWKKCIYNEMVKFQTAIREHRLSSSLRRIIHGQQENISPPTSSGPICRVTPILIKEEPSEVHVMQDTNAFKHELPSVLEHLFNQVKREVDNPENSYSEYETDDSQYLADDVKIVPETDSNEAEEFVDNMLNSYSIETLDAALMKIRDGLSIVAMGCEEIRQALLSINPIEVPQIIKQVPLPRIEGISKSMKTLLEKMPEENIIKNCILHMVEEGKSILRASKETGLLYNAVHEIVYGKKHPG